MNKIKLNEILEDSLVVIPLYLFRLYRKFNLSLEEFFLLMYLYDKNKTVFNPEKMAHELDYEIIVLMDMISNLTDKGFMSVDTVKNDNGFIEEIINLNNFYEKISLAIMDNLNSNEEKNVKSLYEIIEQEFSRKLSPMECEYIKEWQNNNYSDELVKRALKEAVLNGVNNLRYIDKILYEWEKKGYTKVEDIDNNKKEETEVIEEVCNYNDYNWLDDDE